MYADTDHIGRNPIRGILVWGSCCQRCCSIMPGRSGSSSTILPFAGTVLLAGALWSIYPLVAV